MAASSPNPIGRIAPPPPPSHRTGDEWTTDTLAEVLIWLQWEDDMWSDYLHRRLVALEQAVVSRKSRRRLRREIRESVELFAWAGPTFYGKRLEAVSNEFFCRDSR